jgi:hypothetical protein
MDADAATADLLRMRMRTPRKLRFQVRLSGRGAARGPPPGRELPLPPGHRASTGTTAAGHELLRLALRAASHRQGTGRAIQMRTTAGCEPRCRGMLQQNKIVNSSHLKFKIIK